MKDSKLVSRMLILMVCLFSLIACGDDDEGHDGRISIVGTWIDGSKTMKLGSDESYYLTDTSIPDIPQYRKGTYSYNSSLNIFTVNVVAVAGQNSAYRRTYIVQTLTASTLVLLYEDGDVEGYYTRK